MLCFAAGCCWTYRHTSRSSVSSASSSSPGLVWSFFWGRCVSSVVIDQRQHSNQTGWWCMWVNELLGSGVNIVFLVFFCVCKNGRKTERADPYSKRMSIGSIWNWTAVSRRTPLCWEQTPTSLRARPPELCLVEVGPKHLPVTPWPFWEPGCCSCIYLIECVLFVSFPFSFHF